MIPRVVFDTSTLAGAILRRNSTPRKALDFALNLCELCVSLESLAELETVLARPHFARYAPIEARIAFVDFVRRNSRIVSIEASSAFDMQPACRDPKDNLFLALAFAARADLLVSSDDDLLVMHPWRGIAILTPAQFLAEFGV